MRTALLILAVLLVACQWAPTPEPEPAKPAPVAETPDPEPAPPVIAPRPAVDPSTLTPEQNIQRQRVETAARASAKLGQDSLAAKDYASAIGHLQESLDTIRAAKVPLDIQDLEGRVAAMLHQARKDKRTAERERDLKRSAEAARKARQDELDKRGW